MNPHAMKHAIIHDLPIQRSLFNMRKRFDWLSPGRQSRLSSVDNEPTKLNRSRKMANYNAPQLITLRYLANRASLNSDQPRVNFKRFADIAQTREQAEFRSIAEGGEQLFGSAGSTERKNYREIYNNYVKRVVYRHKVLDVPPDWSIDTYLDITEELIDVLSSPYTPPVRNASRSISPKRTTPKSDRSRLVSSLSPTPTLPRVTISPATMSKDTKPSNEDTQHQQQWVEAKFNNTKTAVDFTGGIYSNGVIAWEEENTKVSDGPPKQYATKGNLAWCAGGNPEIALASNPCITGNGKVISAYLPTHSPVMFGTLDSGNSILAPSFKAKQNENKKRDTALDVQMGHLMGQVHNGDVVYKSIDKVQVPFLRHDFLLPPATTAHNRHFNGSTLSVDSSDLEIKVVPINNLHKMDPAKIITEISTALDPEDSKKALLGAINTSQVEYMAHVSFEILGDEKEGFGTSKKETNLADLMSGWGISE